MNKIQAAIYIGTIFIVFIIVLIFFGVIPGLKDDNSANSADLLFWSTYPKSVFEEILNEYGRQNSGVNITYVEKAEKSYESELLNALATGRGPDIWTIPEGLVHRNTDKIFALPSILMTEREFKESFAEAASAAFFQNGQIVGLPFAMDPLVLYWNKDFFASEAIGLPPKTWEEFLSYTGRLTKRSENGNITRAGAAMGLAENIPEAKDIVSLLILQGGTSIVDMQTHAITLGESRLENKIRVSPTESALRFYTDFARRNKTSYTWNNTFPDPVSAFSREEVAMIIGHASNLPAIMEQNAHINVGVSPVPQYSGAPLNITHARSDALTVSFASRYRNQAWQLARHLASQPAAAELAAKFWHTPARRDLLQQGNEIPTLSVFYQSALQARTWYDPAPERTDEIFRNMIESTIAGRDNSGEAYNRLRDILE